MICLKVCIDPHCEEVAHNCDKKETRCRNCGMILIEINEKTYKNKFINNFFQVDYSKQDGGFVKPSEMGYSTQLQMF